MLLSGVIRRSIGKYISVARKENMKFPYRSLFVSCVVCLAFLVVTYNSGHDDVIRSSDGQKRHFHEDGTKEEIHLRFQELARTVNIYFDKFINEHEADNRGLSSDDVHSVLMRHLTSHLNESLSSENILNVIGMVEDLRAALADGHRRKGQLGLSDEQEHVNKEVDLGRLSEHYKVVPTILLTAIESYDLNFAWKTVNTTRIKPRTAFGEHVKVHNVTWNTSSSQPLPLPPWKKFQNLITSYQMYSEEDDVVDDVLDGLKTQKIAYAEHIDGGTEIKVIFTFQDGNRALFKPMRFPRDWDAWPDHYYFHDFERHVAEIAAFHMDRVFGFRRVPPVVGRFINVETEIRKVCEDSEITNTFFTSIAGNRCFYSKCDYYCDALHAVCGRPYLLEGSLMSWLPSRNHLKRTEYENPWRRSYSKKKLARWETEERYCDEVKTWTMYRTGRRLLDLMDITIFDFLAGNLDRHHYYTYNKKFGNDTFLLTYDNGRGFGRAKHDEMSILVPVMQCCLIRASTFHKLMTFEHGKEKLSTAMRRSLEKDPLTPVLTEDHLTALDRRVAIILKELHTCISKHPGNLSEIIVDDGY